MAKKHLTRINQIISQLENIQMEVESLIDEYNRKYEKLSDARQVSDYGQNLEDIVDSLEAALSDGIEIAIDELRNATIFIDDKPKPTEVLNNEINIQIDKKLEWGGLAAYLMLKKQKKDKRSTPEIFSDPFDNHWETSFDWVDEDGDGYDDRYDGF